MPSQADLTAVLYDPPAAGFPHVVVLFDAEREVVAVRPVESIDEGEEALASLLGEAAAERRACT